MTDQPTQPEQSSDRNHSTKGGCQQEHCSPVSDTPETDAAEVAAAPRSGYSYGGWEFARKLERERNAAVSALQDIEARFCDGENTYGDWKFMGDTARKFFDAEKYAEPRGSKERIEEQLRIALDGHPESELWGENGLIAATMRAARMTMDALPGKLVAFNCLENTLGFCMEEMPSTATLGQRVYLCLPNTQEHSTPPKI
jgi:hypothetical protein